MDPSAAGSRRYSFPSRVNVTVPGELSCSCKPGITVSKERTCGLSQGRYLATIRQLGSTGYQLRCVNSLRVGASLSLMRTPNLESWPSPRWIRKNFTVPSETTSLSGFNSLAASFTPGEGWKRTCPACNVKTPICAGSDAGSGTSALGSEPARLSPSFSQLRPTTDVQPSS